MKPLDLSEWAQALRVVSEDSLAQFGLEVLELIDRDVSEQYWELIERLEKVTGTKLNPEGEWWRLVEKIEDTYGASKERKEAKAERAKKICAAKMLPKPLEYDL